MHIALTTIGTTGDITPFLRLAEGLNSRHTVTVVTHERHRNKCEQKGLRFVPVGPTMDDETIRNIGQRTASAKDIFQQLTILRDFFLSDAEADYKRMHAAFSAGGEDRIDLVVCHAIHNIAQAAAEDASLPWIRVQLEPSSIHTVHAAPSPLPSMGKALNGWLWKQIEAQLTKLDQPLQTCLRQLGSKSRAHRLFRTKSTQLNLVACSRHIAHFYDDLPADYEVTGAWLAPVDETYQPPDALAQFLAQHPSPLVFSFGSMAGEDANHTCEILVKTVEKLGRPAIIQKGAAVLSSYHPPKNVLFWDFVPHNYLFPKAACVIHHGGAGTLATACAAGVPSVIIPHLGDQFYWGQQVYKRGLGPKPIPIKKLSVKRLTKQIGAALAPTMATNAKATAEAMRQESGVTAAIDAIERCIA